jgi:endonuclease/exonuclease/phosphatase family metal-dependent hydrolase
MRLTFGSYNIHKAVGADGRRDADRIIRVLHELNADVVALQESDLRFGTHAARIDLPALEPRGAVYARLSKDGRQFVVAGAHLDLSGLLRRRQIKAVCNVLEPGSNPAVIMGDLNEWSARGGALKAFGAGWQVLNPGHSFPARRPIASLDRFAHTPHWHGARVFHSALAVAASDHLPVRAELELGA